jgi:hypothetical protein
MLGLLALGLTSVMIYTLVKNALLGKQLSKDDTFSGPIDLIIPITAHAEFFFEAWPKNLSPNVKVTVLVDGSHLNVEKKHPYLNIHHFPMRPATAEAIPWMIEQVLDQIQGQVVIIGDAELVPTEQAFISIAKNVIEKQRAYFVLPQTVKLSFLGEAISVLNTTLALTSFFGRKRWRRNFTHPLLGISEGWVAMNLQTFRELDFKHARSHFKEFISRQWAMKGKPFYLAFGEKHLLRFYPEDLKVHLKQLRDKWDDLWNQKHKTGFWLYVVSVFIWAFPILFFVSHPFWAMAGFLLTFLYRFFSKIVFQESWIAVILHPIGCLAWVGTFGWWLVDLWRGRK